MTALNEKKCMDRDLCFESMAELIKLKTNAERALSAVTQKYGLSPVQAIILHLIDESENPTVSTVFRTLDLNQGNVSSTCKKLESAGYILRRRSENDERRVVLMLTDKGQTSLSQINREVSERYPFVREFGQIEFEKAKECILTLKNLAAKLNAMLLNSEGSDTNA